MSFRNRLGLFFVLIVIVPMVAVAVLLFGLLGESERSMGRANIDARQQVAVRLFADEKRAANRSLRVVANDRVFSSSIQAGDSARAEKRARQLLRSRRLARIVLVDGDAVVLAVGDSAAVAPAVRPLVIEKTKTELGRLAVSRIDADAFAGLLRRITALDVVIRDGDRLLATTFAKGAAPRAPAGADTTVEVGGERYRVAAIRGGFPGQKITILTFGIPGVTTPAAGSRLVIGAILLGFLLLAMACAVLVSRSLQQQLAAFLDAARRLAAGDFSAQVTTVGKDEFAGLGEEFNKMSRELERRLVELEQERERVQDSMRRLGDAVASKLDRDALLEIVVRTAVDGVNADAGRAQVRGPDHVTLQQSAGHGNMNGLEAAVEAVEADALRTGRPRESSGDRANAMAHPLRSTGTGSEALGVVSVARTKRPFTPNERELFHYLAGQAARSMEDVDRHETVSREAVTDNLTGLLNRGAFNEALRSEAVRSERLGSPLGLVLIDLDDFKAVNDSYGHPQGDLVLREVGRVLRESSREIDHPARYGGEELALVLPGTDLDGAFNFAERVRERIAGLSIPYLNGSGELQITASLGVAAVPSTPADDEALIEAADSALYEAKRSGKNKSVRAR